MDLANSVILPREDFIELSTVAWNQPPTSAKERVATTLQTSTIFMGAALAFGAGSWIWYKAMARLEDKKHENLIAEIDARENAKK